MPVQPLEDADDVRDLEFRWLVEQLHARGVENLLGFFLEFGAVWMLRSELETHLREYVQRGGAK